MSGVRNRYALFLKPTDSFERKYFMKRLTIAAAVAALCFSTPGFTASKSASGAAKSKATSSAAKSARTSGAAKSKATSSAAKSRANSKR